MRVVITLLLVSMLLFNVCEASWLTSIKNMFHSLFGKNKPSAVQPQSRQLFLGNLFTDEERWKGFVYHFFARGAINPSNKFLKCFETKEKEWIQNIWTITFKGSFMKSVEDVTPWFNDIKSWLISIPSATQKCILQSYEWERWTGFTQTPELSLDDILKNIKKVILSDFKFYSEIIKNVHAILSNPKPKIAGFLLGELYRSAANPNIKWYEFKDDYGGSDVIMWWSAFHNNIVHDFWGGNDFNRCFERYEANYLAFVSNILFRGRVLVTEKEINKYFDSISEWMTDLPLPTMKCILENQQFQWFTMNLGIKGRSLEELIQTAKRNMIANLKENQQILNEVEAEIRNEYWSSVGQKVLPMIKGLVKP